MIMYTNLSVAWQFKKNMKNKQNQNCSQNIKSKYISKSNASTQVCLVEWELNSSTRINYCKNPVYQGNAHTSRAVLTEPVILTLEKPSLSLD